MAFFYPKTHEKQQVYQQINQVINKYLKKNRKRLYGKEFLLNLFSLTKCLTNN